MLRLILLRHAKSAWPQGVADRDRPLGPRGRMNAPAMGTYMSEHDLIPALALISPSRRTLETWTEATRDWDKAPELMFEEAIYEAPAARLLGLIHQQSDASPLMVVGHNPGMENLAALLLTQKEREKLPGKYPTAGLCVIDFDAGGWPDVKPGTGTLERFVTPRSLNLGPEED